MALTDISKTAAENSGSGGVNPDDFERLSLDGMTYAMPHPTIAVGGTARHLRLIPTGPDSDGEQPTVLLIVDNPFVYSEEAEFGGTGIVQSDSEKGDDYKVVNFDDSDTEEIEGSGITFDGNFFSGEVIEEFSEDQIGIKLENKAGLRAAKTLDVKGAVDAGVSTNDAGEVILKENGWPEYNGGLIEYFNNEGDDYTPPRYARDTELRPDMEGEEVVFLLERTRDVIDDYDGDSYWSTVLVADENAEDGYVSVSPTDEFEPDETMVAATQWLTNFPGSEEEIESFVEENGGAAN